MLKHILFFLSIIALSFTQSTFAQTKEARKADPNSFDEKAAYEHVKATGVDASEIEGCVQFLKADFSSRKALAKQIHKHTPYENAHNVNEKVIYLNGDNKPTGIGCPNAGFENYDFTNWSGDHGTYTGSQLSPAYSFTPGIINTAGNNTPLGNTINDQTILSIPPSNPNYPNCIGYDSMACPSGGPLISQIPFISPYSLDGVSCRLLGAYGGGFQGSVSRLKYIMNVTPSNKLFSYSYAIVLNDGHSGTPGTHQPYFTVTVKDQNGNPVLGCQSFYQDATGALADTTFKPSHLPFGGPVIYRPWHLVSIDLSSPTHSLVTSISIEFEVAGCSGGAHLGYAYVDAECGGGGISAAFCSGTTAVLTAPPGYTNYQWYDNVGSPIAAPTGTNTTLTVNSPVVGDTYSVTMNTPGGCTITLTKTISITNVSIANINSAPSCAGGNSGLATVTPAGSNGVYSYTWTSLQSGLPVSNSQTATGLAAGGYSVLVSSPTCGQASSNLSVGTSPPFYINQAKSFCGNSTSINQPNGSNYTWYQNSTLIPGEINSILNISPAIAGDFYTVVYNNSQGCKDSISYSLNQIAGGSTYFSNTTNVCPNGSNGTTVLNLNTPFASPYSYIVTGPTAATTVTNVSTPATSITISSLAPGTYTAIITDGVCIYNNTVTIGNIATNFTVTPTNTVLCFPEAVTMNLDFGNPAPTSCGLDANTCAGTPTQLFTSGPFTQNSDMTYPTPYGNYYTHAKHQFLVKKSDLNAAGITAGKISSLAFNVLDLNTGTSNYLNFNIKMGCTNLSALPNASVTPVPFIAGLTSVYSTASEPIAVGWVTHNFNQSYNWDGVSNIIIEMCFGMNSPFTYTYNASVELKQVPYLSNIFYIEDSNPVCSGNQLAGSGGSSFSYMANGANMLPNMRFGYCAAPPASSYTVAVSSNGTITDNYANDSIKVAPAFTTPAGSVIYTISVTNPIGGCIAQRTLEVIYPPVATSITATATSTTLCEGGNTTLSASGAYNYSWFYLQSGVQVPIATSSSINVTPPAIGTNTYIVVGYESCASSIPDTKIITVNVVPITNLIITPLQDVTKCLNKTFTFNAGVGSAIPGNQGTPYSYAWTTLPGNNAAPGINNGAGYTTSSNSTTTLVVTVTGNCANSTSDTVVIKNFIDDLSISIIDSSTTCANTAFTLNAIASGGYPAYGYMWTITPDGATLSNTSSLSSTSPENEGNYIVTVFVNDSCGYGRNDIEIIKVLPPCTVGIPNVMTPNGDNANESFLIKNIEFHPNTSVIIFDRWGRKVYENPNYNNEWKAEGISDGTFFYVIEVPDDKKYSGFITIFRGK